MEEEERMRKLEEECMMAKLAEEMAHKEAMERRAMELKRQDE